MCVLSVHSSAPYLYPVLSQRHVNVHGHNALADMLSLYMAEQLCITRQELARGRLLAKADTPWPTEDTWGKVPRLRAWEKVRRQSRRSLRAWIADGDVPRRQFTATGRVDQSAPVCNFAASKSHPLLPMHSSRAAVIGGSPTIHDEHMSAGWQRVEWNDKAAWSSSEPGSVIRFPAEGSTVGVAVVRDVLQSRARHKSTNLSPRSGPGLGRRRA